MNVNYDYKMINTHEHLIFNRFQAILSDNEKAVEALLKLGVNIDHKAKDLEAESKYKETIATDILKRVGAFRSSHQYFTIIHYIVISLIVYRI